MDVIYSQPFGRLCCRDRASKLYFMLKTILDEKNIEGAYLDLVQKFDETSKSHRYCGVDGITLNDITATSAAVLRQVKKELIELTPIDPVLETIIPKKDGTPRRIYIYTIKDRIKAQALYRVVEPIFEEKLSAFLFSYRTSHPHYLAAKSIAKRYKKHYGKDTVLISDVSDYFAHIDKPILREKLADLGLDQEVISLLNLFIDNSILTERKIIYPEVGLISGVPLIVIFANLYLNDIDQYVGGKVALYRRVGDDFILFDKDRAKIVAMQEYLFKETKKLKLTIKKEKTKLIQSDEPFVFLGHLFSKGKISIPSRSVRRATIRWNKVLKYYPIPIKLKLKRLDRLLYLDAESIHSEFVQMIGIYRQVTDEEQIKNISEEFFRILTNYLYGSYSERTQRLTKKLTAGMPIPSLYKYYLDFHNGKETITSLSLSKKRRHQTRASTHFSFQRAKKIRS